jgi:hypothetical protein
MATISAQLLELKRRLDAANVGSSNVMHRWRQSSDQTIRATADAIDQELAPYFDQLTLIAAELA